jgi:hypothetical protein
MNGPNLNIQQAHPQTYSSKAYFMTFTQEQPIGKTLPVQLFLGDALEQMQLIPDGTIDMVLTDLPYG